MRIEDVDVPRGVPGAETAILDALHAHGFAWDAPPLRQSDRTHCYAVALETLAARGLTYACACTRRDLALAPVRHGETIYPGTCAGGIDALRARRAQRSIRLRVAPVRVSLVDRVQGPQSQSLADEAGDFVLKRADGWFAYQLAVVVDDAAQGVTSVVRGADLLAATPRQIHLQQALGLPTPSYLHVPVAVDARGRKLSKQSGAAPLAGDPVDALVAAWAFLRQPAPLTAPSSVGEFWSHATRSWTPTRIPRVAALRIGEPAQDDA